MEDKRKKRVRRLKEAIISLAVFFLIVPVIFSSIILREVTDQKKKLDFLESAVESLNEELVTYKDKIDAYGSNILVIDAKDSENDDNTEVKNNESLKKENIKESSEVSSNTGILPDENVPKVYLTFDDGPSDNTDRILDILAENDVKATFFTVGHTDDASASHYKRILREGHTLAMHSYSHKYSKVYESESAFKKDYTKISKLLRKYIGSKPLYYRFPGGSSNSVSKVPMSDLITFLEAEGVTYFDWNVASGDADKEPLTAEEIYKNVIDGVNGKDTSVVLMHDLAGKDSTVEALPRIIKKLLDEGYRILPIDENTEPVHHTIRK